MTQESLRGVTSNPAIFEHSILQGNDYDEQIASMARQGLDADSIYDAIAVADVQGAADVLAVVHVESGGRDGFVSIEVPPTLARDTDGTIAAARRYWKSVDRANTMIKIPGTPEGVGAIEQAIYEGSTSTSRCCSRCRPTPRSPRPISAASSAGTLMGFRST